MNNRLQDCARQTLKDDLAKLPESWQRKFKLMYDRQNGNRSVEDAEALTTNEVVDAMAEEKLDWAMQQVENSLKKLVID